MPYTIINTIFIFTHMIGHIYIKGQIGNSINRTTGEVEERGVELQDVIMQVEANKDAEAYHIHINSKGGSVDKGKIIAEYISKLTNAYTIAEEFCASMGTEIHLSVPVERRKIVEGTVYMIHNPLLKDVTGNADELERAASIVRPIEKQMLSMYVNKTGADKFALEGLMKSEASLTEEQCKTLGFVSEIVPKIELKAVAFIDEPAKKDNNKTEYVTKKDLKDMENSTLDKIRLAVAEVIAPKKEDVKAAMVATDGGELSYASEGELPEVGEVVMIGEEIAPAGTYTDESETVIVVAEEGVVESVTIKEEEVEATKEELQAKIEKLEADAEVKETEMIDAFKTEVEGLKEAHAAELAKIGSDYKPQASAKTFNKNAKAPVLSMKDKVAARKEELKK